MVLKDKILVFTAQHSGFGPVSKMLSIALFFKKQRKYFIGEGIALEYVNNTGGKLFEKIIDSSKVSAEELSKVLKKSTVVIDVMNHDIAFLAYINGVKYFFFDSLFGFWYSKKSDLNLFRRFENLKKGNKFSRLEYDKFSIHEKKMLAHFLSEKSFIQNFFGVADRYSKLKKYLSKSYLVEPFASDLVVAQKTKPEAGLVVINIGGVKNFIIKDNQSSYFDFILKVSKRLVLENSLKIKKIIICSGLYGVHDILYDNQGKKIIHKFLKNKLFIDLVKKSEICLSSAGLTSIYEFLYLKKRVVYLPEQHSSQYYNMAEIKKTSLGKCSVSIKDIFKKIKVSKNDYTGSCDIVNYIKYLDSNDYYFGEAYRQIFNKIVGCKKDKINFKFKEISSKLKKNTISLNESITIIQKSI
jgi:hypothetical protein